MKKQIEKKVLLTGVTGFIGGHLAEKLLRNGWKVYCLIRPTSALNGIQHLLKMGLSLYQVNKNNSNLKDLVSAIQPEIVIHLASLFLAQHKDEDINDLIESNVTFPTQLVDAMVQNGIYNLINTGTSWQHFQNENYNPVCLYAATKEAFSSMLKFYEETTPLQVVTLKLYDTYGPNDKRPKLLALLKNLAETDQMLAMSAGQQYIDLVHVNDVTDAFLLVTQRFFQGEGKYLSNDYAISSGNIIKLRELVDLYERIIGRKLNIKWGERAYRPREVMVPWNIGKALPGWRPKISLESGIRDILMKYD